MKCKQSCGDYACDSGCIQATNIKKSFKKLSDEKIYDLWCDADNTECMPEMRNKDGSVNYIIITFAELIIKASRGEE